MLFLPSFLHLFLPFFYHLLSILSLPGQWRNTWSRRACRCKGRNSRMARHGGFHQIVPCFKPTLTGNLSLLRLLEKKRMRASGWGPFLPRQCGNECMEKIDKYHLKWIEMVKFHQSKCCLVNGRMVCHGTMVDQLWKN